MPMTLLEFMPKKSLLQEFVGGYVISCYIVHEGETSENEVKDIYDVDYVSSDNEGQVSSGNLVKHLKENPDTEKESPPTSSKLKLSTCMATITFTDEDL